MRKFNILDRWSWTFLVTIPLALGLAGCDGDNGAPGAAGTSGTPGAAGQACWDLNGNGAQDLATEDLNGDGVADVLDCGAGSDPVAEAVAAAKIESCATCHGGIGDGHQAVYAEYKDTTLALTIDNFVSVPNLVTGGFDVTLDFSITKNGQPYIDAVGFAPSLDSTAFYFVEYDGVSGDFLNSAGGFNFGLSTGNAASNGDGTYTLAQNVSVDPTAFASGALVGRIANGPIDIEERQAGKRITMYADNASAFWEFGDINAFVSPANVEGCQNCHGIPYFKHGNLPGMVAGTPDFTICKSCHNSSSAGGHPEWQHMVDNPLAWATGTPLTAEEQALYAYDRTLVNDVHMSHAMEFPYPQSMANCSTCHAGNLAAVLDNANFTPETCKSCHVIRGINAQPDDDYYQAHRPPPFEYLWSRGADLSFHLTSALPCTNCHGAGAPEFSDYHTGYDPTIYDATTGTKYADLYTVSIDLLTWDDVNSTLKIDFRANDPSVGIVPEVLVSFYGWDSKNFLIPSHARDGGGNRFEYEPGDVNPLFSDFAETAPGVWTVTANLAAFQGAETADLLTLIANEDVKKAEVSITPTLDLNGTRVVLRAVDATFDLSTGMDVAGYFKGANSTVEITKCNKCHDALASSFHDGSGRGGDGIEVCKNCHNPTFAGGHLEMASRSIDNYVHAIHSFQDFDLQGGRSPGIFDAFDPVFAKRYDQHIEHAFPYFTAQACEACHREGKYNVPDQSESMPGLLSDSWMLNTWYSIDPATGAALVDPAGRNIGFVPEYVVGPASRACGGCHRAELINEDKAGDLAAFNAHTAAFGTLVENDTADSVDDPDDEILFGVIDKIMSLFE